MGNLRKQCRAPGCKKLARSKSDGFCQAHYTERTQSVYDLSPESARDAVMSTMDEDIDFNCTTDCTSGTVHNVYAIRGGGPQDAEVVLSRARPHTAFDDHAEEISVSTLEALTLLCRLDPDNPQRYADLISAAQAIHGRLTSPR